MKNKFKIIETPDYVLAVSDEAGNQGAYRLEYMPHKPHCYTRIYCNKLKNSTVVLWDKGTWKGEAGFTYEIIAYQPKNNAPKLDLPLLPEIVVEDDVEKLAWKHCKKVNSNVGYHDFISGYNKGHKAATKIYSEKDLREAIAEAWNSCEDNEDNETFTQVFDRIIQSLKQPKTPKWFVAEMQTTKSEVFRENDNAPYATLKTTTINGKTYLVGYYE